jgi:5-methylcytosine-specific restriction endonuclease McrA
MFKKNEDKLLSDIRQLCEDTGISFETFLKEKTEEIHLRKLLLSIPHPRWYRNNRGKLDRYLRKVGITADPGLIERILTPYFGRDAVDDPTYRSAAKKRLLEKSGYRCDYCKKVVDETNAEVDHFIPLVLHGADDEPNWKISCADCNRGKSDSMLEECLFFWSTRLSELIRRGKDTITKYERFAIFCRYQFVCSSCKEDNLELKVVFRIPPKRGGQAVYDNLTVLCEKCISTSEVTECKLSLQP